MGKKDIITKDYVQENRVFADIFNKLIYEGNNVIDPEKLKPLDTSLISVPYGTNASYLPVQKYRDVMKCLSLMADDSAVYLLLGVELQSETHYAMPVRNMVYDALQYASQVENSLKAHRIKNGVKDKRQPTKAEYLSGFYKEDRLVPVITLTLHLGTEKWDEEVVNVCQAWEEMREDAKRDGKIEGKMEGERSAKLALAKKMLQTGRYTLEEISELTEIAIEDIKSMFQTSKNLSKS